MAKNKSTDLHAERQRLDRDIMAAKAALQDALRIGADTGPLRADLRSAEDHRADIDLRLDKLAAAIEAKADLKARQEAAELAADIQAGIDAKMAALQAPPHPVLA